MRRLPGYFYQLIFIIMTVMLATDDSLRVVFIGNIIN